MTIKRVVRYLRNTTAVDNQTIQLRRRIMKKTMMLTLAGLCLNTGAGAADTMAVSGIAPDTAKRVETPVCIKEPTVMNTVPKDGAGGGINLGMGVYNQSLGKLNNVLARHGFNTLDENMTSFSFGFFGLINPQSRFGLDFEFLWSEPASAVSDSNTFGSVKMHGYSIGLKGGHDIVNRPKWGIMPVYGVGYYSHTYDFKPRNATFDDVLNGNDKDAVQLNYSGVSLTAGLNIHVKTKFDKDTKENGKLHQPTAGLNLEGGVHYYPSRNMSVGENTLDNGPQMSRYGIYLKLYLDLGEKVSLLPNKDKD